MQTKGICGTSTNAVVSFTLLFSQTSKQWLVVFHLGNILLSDQEICTAGLQFSINKYLSTSFLHSTSLLGNHIKVRFILFSHRAIHEVTKACEFQPEIRNWLTLHPSYVYTVGNQLAHSIYANHELSDWYYRQWP